MMARTLADTFDSYVKWIVLFFLLTAVNLSMEACAYLMNDAAGEMVRAWALWPARASGLAVVIALFVWLRLPGRDRQHGAQRALVGEYVMDVIKRSVLVAFVLTIVVLALLDNLANHTELPADFFIKLPGVSLTGGFSIAFILFNLRSGEDSDEDGEDQ